MPCSGAMHWPHLPPWEEPEPHRYGAYGRPGGRACLRCHMATWRPDLVCSACTGELERMIERIELEAMVADLDLLVRFDAYCASRASR